jgi:hypothetical protein
MVDPAQPPSPDEPPAPPAPPAPEEDPPLGPEGEKALGIWKERARVAEAEAKRARDLEAELATLRTAQMSEQERAVEAAKAEGRAEAATESLRERFTDRLAAIATPKVTDADLFSDPDVALRLLGLTTIPVTPTGGIDAEAISAAVDSLVETKPYLAASATPSAGSADQGTRPRPPAPADLDTQIREAEAAGKWDVAGQLKLQKLAAAPRP